MRIKELLPEIDNENYNVELIFASIMCEIF